jgi:hypothetical protein
MTDYTMEMLVIASQVLYGCTKALFYLNYYQAITGIDVISLIGNNPAALQNILVVVIQTVHSHMSSMSTEVFLSDDDLWGMISYVIRECSDGDNIRAETLVELGLNTNSIIAYLISIGFTIL